MTETRNAAVSMMLLAGGAFLGAQVSSCDSAGSPDAGPEIDAGLPRVDGGGDGGGGLDGGPPIDAGVDAGAPIDGGADGGIEPDGGMDGGVDDAGSDAGWVTTVFTIVLSHQDYAEVVGSASAPYANSLIAQYGLATSYVDCQHPDLGNYLCMVSGDAQYPGFIAVDPTQAPYFPASGDNLGNQLQVAGIPWRSYQESAGTPCALSGAGNYTPTHDPFLYFSDIQNDLGGLCASTNVDYTQFAADLAAGTYRYLWITPNLVDDGHDPTNQPATALAQADSWLSVEVPKILASDSYKKGGVLFITWDEAEGRNGDDPDQVAMIVVTPRLTTAGFRSNVAYSHFSYLATVEELFSLPKLGAAATANSMQEFLK